MCSGDIACKGIFRCSNINERVVSISMNTFISYELGQTRVLFDPFFTHLENRLAERGYGKN